MNIDKFIAFIENTYRFSIKNKDKLGSLIDEYSNLNFHNNIDDLRKKQTIDNVFVTLYDVTLEKLVEDFKSESKIRKIESEESRLRKRIGELEETVGELRDAYWRVKHPNMRT